MASVFDLDAGEFVVRRLVGKNDGVAGIESGEDFNCRSADGTESNVEALRGVAIVDDLIHCRFTSGKRALLYS
jgi:hypothetical protein